MLAVQRFRFSPGQRSLRALLFSLLVVFVLLFDQPYCCANTPLRDNRLCPNPSADPSSRLKEGGTTNWVFQHTRQLHTAGKVSCEQIMRGILVSFSGICEPLHCFKEPVPGLVDAKHGFERPPASVTIYGFTGLFLDSVSCFLMTDILPILDPFPSITVSKSRSDDRFNNRWAESPSHAELKATVRSQVVYSD